MNKKINFFANKFKIIQVSENIKNKFGIIVEIVGDTSYTLEELELIKKQLSKNKITLEIPINNNSNIDNYKEEYKKKKCKECIYFNIKYGCRNGKAKVRNKATKTSNDKGCYWGEWNNGN